MREQREARNGWFSLHIYGCMDKTNMSFEYGHCGQSTRTCLLNTVVETLKNTLSKSNDSNVSDSRHKIRAEGFFIVLVPIVAALYHTFFASPFDI